MGKKGFTLLELLVSMAVASGLMLLLLTLMSSSSDTYNKAARTIAQRVDGRSGIHLLKRDIAGQLGGREILYEQGTLGQAWPCDEFGFFTVKTAASQGDPNALGDVCFVRYYVAENDVFSDGYSRKLYRQFLISSNAKDVIQTGISTGAPAVDPTVDEVIAVNVVQFSVSLWTRPDSSSAWVEWTTASPTAPLRADISLIIADSKIARRLTTSEDWDSPAKLGTPAFPKGEALLSDYSTRVSLK